MADDNDSNWTVPPAASYTMSAFVLLFALFGSCITIHLLHNHCGFNTKEKSQAPTSKKSDMSWTTKGWLMSSIICSFLAMWTFLVYRVYMYTGPILTEHFCHFYPIASFVLYIISKNSAYGFFKQRLADTLNGTTIAYSRRFMGALCMTNTFMTLLQIGLMIRGTWDMKVERLQNLAGSVCVPEEMNVYFWTFLCLSFGYDILCAVGVSYLLVCKLLILVKESVNLNLTQSTNHLIATSPRVTPKHVEKFHTASIHDNKLLVICSKLVILTSIAAFSSIVFIIMIVSGIMADSAIIMDIVINMAVLWLNFKFAERWFYILQCHWFVQWTFPCLKTCALTGNLNSVCCNCCKKEDDQTRLNSTESAMGTHHVVNASPSLSPNTSPRTEDLNIDNNMKAMEEQIDNDKQSGHDSQFSFSIDQVGVSKKAEDLDMDNEYHCCGCCCTTKSRNLYHLSVLEYCMYIHDDYDCPCEQKKKNKNKE